MFASATSPGRESFSPRRLLTLAAAALMCGFFVNATSARADSSSTLTVVGTSDVSDSGLVQNVIMPDFENAYPQFSFHYIGTATGTAIKDAETGANEPSALIVHAASLENQFVANGFSYEQYGRPIFTNDFVLAGPKADPAGVSANGAHNIAQAFADVAAAGISGKAEFVSRGGTPGTTVEEHTIWNLVNENNLAPSGLLLCAVSTANGGGLTPIAAGNGVTVSGQPCPGGGALPTGPALPKWYAATGLTQGPNVQNANACNGYPSGANSCYVLTDRGTYDYLSSGKDPAGSIPNLTIQTRDDDASAPGGQYALVNYFHAYVINPSKPGESVNLTAAKDFLNLVTSPGFQSQLKNYLATADPGGPPFKADASPNITVKAGHGIPSTFKAGKKVTVSGTLTNAEPGYPALAGKTVSIEQLVGGLPLTTAGSARTNSSGAFSITFTPTSTGSYVITTKQIAQIENSVLMPPFGDLLSPAATSKINVTVHGAITGLRIKSESGKAVVLGSVAPGSGHAQATLTVMARPAGSKHGFKRVATDRLSANDGNFAAAVPLAAGRWQFKLKFQDGTRIVAATSKVTTGTVGPRAATSVTPRSVKVKNGKVTVTGSVSAGGGKVALLALRTTGGAARFGTLARANVSGSKFTLHAKLRRGSRWVLQLEYLKGAPSYSGLRATNVR
jgi:ABC-type tungstate transport system permease subunit